MKHYCLNNFFKIYSIDFFPIKYITQNKEKDTLHNSCFKNLVAEIRKDDISSISQGVFFAITNDTVMRVLKKKNNVNLIVDIKVPLLLAKCNVTGLKKYLTGEYTQCGACKNSNLCKYKRVAEKESEIKQWHVILIRL